MFREAKLLKVYIRVVDPVFSVAAGNTDNVALSISWTTDGFSTFTHAVTQALLDKSISAPNEFGRSAEALLAELLVNMTAEWRVKPSSCRRELM